MSLLNEIRLYSEELDVSGKKITVLPVDMEIKLAKKEKRNQHEIQKGALECSILPGRYLKITEPWE